MSQTMTLSPASTHTTHTTPACPAWCTEIAHFDDSPHFGALFDIDVSLADPMHVVTTDGPAEVSDFLTVALFQDADGGTPVIGMSSCALASDDTELPDMTLDEAESLARALLELVRRGMATA